MRAWSLSIVSLAGCAAIIGGLDEGRADRDVDAGLRDGSTEVVIPCRRDWLVGSARRTTFTLESRASMTTRDLTIPLYLDTHRWIGTHRMRTDGLDLRVTGHDGRTPLRFAFGSPIDSEAAKLWVRIDVPPGTSNVYVYYGGDPVLDAGLHRDVFFDGIFPPLERGAWRADSPEATLGDGGVTATLSRAKTNAGIANWCVTAGFPEGHRWQIVFDLASGKVVGDGTFSVSVGGQPVFSTKEKAPYTDAISNRTIEPGHQAVCFAVGLPPEAEPADEVTATFSNLRARVEGQPLITASGIEEEPCPP